jgi:hypothetical protein
LWHTATRMCHYFSDEQFSNLLNSIARWSRHHVPKAEFEEPFDTASAIAALSLKPFNLRRAANRGACRKY